ncbi:MAG: hypothetical protein V4754_15795 [Pseudomonadota bacterium]
MRKLTLLLLFGLCQLAGADEQEKTSPELNQWNPLHARYKIHSGDTADSTLPTKIDSAFSAVFADESAKQVFDQIGPDVKPVCDDTNGYRERRKKGVFCTFTPRLKNPENSHYRCWIGINLRTGAGDVRTSC